MKDNERNRFGLYDQAMPFRKKAEMEITDQELEAQLDEGAFLMDCQEAVKFGFIHPDNESDSVIVGIGGKE